MKNQTKKNINSYFQVLMLAMTLLSACGKNDYLDIDAADRPPLSAKVKFVNARNVPGGVYFWDFTRQATAVALEQHKATSDYVDTQYGKVQFNLTEGLNSTYKASYVFGGSANFVQETNTASYSGPNGPIATFYHTVFAVKKLKASTLNPGNTDSLILVYDDLAAPASGKAKLRFANFATPARVVDLQYQNGTSLFTGVAYGNFGGQVVISYTGGKSTSTIAGLSWKTLGPFTEVDSGTGQDFQLRDVATGLPLTVEGLDDLNLEAGKIYTLFVSSVSSTATSALKATLLVHN